METLPKISASPLKNDTALYARLDVLQNQLNVGQATNAAIVSLLSDGLTALNNALINLRAEQKSALSALSGKLSEGRYREVADLVTDRFGAVAQEFQGAKAEIVNRLNDLETSLVPTGDDAAKVEQQVIPDYTSDFVLLGQRVSEIQNKILAAESESTSLTAKFDAFSASLTESVDAKLSAVEAKIVTAQSMQQNQLDVMKGEATQNFRTITGAVNEMVTATATSVQALSDTIQVLNDSIEQLRSSAATTAPVEPTTEPTTVEEPVAEPVTEVVAEAPTEPIVEVEQPKGPEITGTVITPEEGVDDV
jgi:hypothetical protein